MSPALPTVAAEMEHHRGFQTFAALHRDVRPIVIDTERA
jgi:hypothetical protein